LPESWLGGRPRKVEGVQEFIESHTGRPIGMQLNLPLRG
jgi:hypothetical protein